MNLEDFRVSSRKIRKLVYDLKYSVNLLLRPINSISAVGWCWENGCCSVPEVFPITSELKKLAKFPYLIFRVLYEVLCVHLVHVQVVDFRHGVQGLYLRVVIFHCTIHCSLLRLQCHVGACS